MREKLQNWYQKRVVPRLARALLSLSVWEADIRLRKSGPITILMDNSVIGHGVTHETAWVSTGTKLWGGTVPSETGYSAQVPVYSQTNSSRTYHEVRFLPGIAELARRGRIRLVTSAEITAEALRHPIGRYWGYYYFDHNVFNGIRMPSIDGYHFDPVDAKDRQQTRLRTSTEEPFLTIAAMLPDRSNLDAWHIHTAHKYGLYCFLALDFPLAKNMKQASRRAGFPKLATKMLLPSQLGEALGIRPVDVQLQALDSSAWFMRPDLNLPGEKRSSPRSSRSRE